MQSNETIQTTMNAQPPPSSPDWERIRKDFEDGEVSIREIARRHGLSDTAVRKRAIAHQWDVSSRAPEEPANHPKNAAQTGVQTGLQTAHHSDGVNLGKVVEVPASCSHTPQPSEEDEDRFCWHPDDPSILLRSQRAVAVYLNPHEDVVIRQEMDMYDDGDSLIIIGQRDVPALIAKLHELIS